MDFTQRSQQRKESVFGRPGNPLNAAKDFPWPNFKTPNTKPFSQKEAEGLYGPLKDALGEFFYYVDEVISRTNRKGTHCYIWSSIDDHSMTFIVTAMIKSAQRSGRAAWAVRGAIDSVGYLQAGAITIPRFIATFTFYVENGGVGFPKVMY